MIPTTPEALRIGAMFNRRPTSQWNEREVRQFKKLKKDGCFADVTEIALLERYYQAERRKGDKGVHRRDLQTLLNNWPGELDRARAWDEEQVNQRLRRAGNKIAEKRETDPKPASDEDFKAAGEFARKEIERLRAQLFPQHQESA